MQTTTAELFSQIQAASPSMSSVKSQLLDNFKSSKEYRHAFVEEKVQTQLAIQTKAIREQRGISRPAFANLMNKAPSWVFRLEDPNQPPPTISTLLKVAEAFDVDLEISFRPFSHLLNRLERMTPDSFLVPSFDEEIKERAFDNSGVNEQVWRAFLRGMAGEHSIGFRIAAEHSWQGEAGASKPELQFLGVPHHAVASEGTGKIRARRTRKRHLFLIKGKAA